MWHAVASIADKLTDVLIGSKRSRYGPRPSQENYGHMRARLSTCLRKGRPVEIVTPWGADKCYNRFDMKEADLVDLKALERLSRLQKDVCGLHVAGVHITILWEDLTTRLLAGSVDNVYLYSLMRMIAVLDMKYVSIVRESALANAANPRFEELALANARVISNGREATIGWRGEIDWSCLLRRAANTNPSLTLEEKREQVCLYLGIAMARHQSAILPVHDVKLSFMPYSHKVSDSMRRNRIEYKVKESLNSKRVNAPWTSYGLLRPQVSSWSPLCVSEYAAASGSYNKTYVREHGIDIPALMEVSR